MIMDWMRDKIAELEDQAKQYKAREKNPRTDPHDACNAGEMAKAAANELKRLRAAEALSKQAVETITQVGNALRASRFESRARSIAMTHLETAALWLMTETL